MGHFHFTGKAVGLVIIPISGLWLKSFILTRISL